MKKMTKMQRFLEFGEKAEAEPRERRADSPISGWESVALAVKGSDLNTTEGNFVPAARCIQHTKEKQLVTRSGLQRPRCCVCHLHHERAMNAPVSVEQIIQTVLQQVHHFEVDVIAGDANAAAYKYNKRQENQDLHSSSVAIMLREMRREVNTGCHLKAGFTLIILPIIILLSVAQKVILIVALWLFSNGASHLDPAL